jgi:hypothetical protein
LLKKKSPTEEAGSSSDKVEHPEVTNGLRGRGRGRTPATEEKRPFPGCPKLLDEAIFSGNTINNILYVTFIHEVLAKNPRTSVSPTVSPAKLINPQPISTALPHTEKPLGQPRMLSTLSMTLSLTPVYLPL